MCNPVAAISLPISWIQCQSNVSSYTSKPRGFESESTRFLRRESPVIRRQPRVIVVVMVKMLRRACRCSKVDNLLSLSLSISLPPSLPPSRPPSLSLDLFFKYFSFFFFTQNFFISGVIPHREVFLAVWFRNNTYTWYLTLDNSSPLIRIHTELRSRSDFWNPPKSWRNILL